MTTEQPSVPEPIKPPFKVRKKVRAYLHASGVHLLCRIRFVPEITGWDRSTKLLPGPEHTETDPVTGDVTTTREFIDATTFGGDPIYSGKVREVHR